MHAYIILNVAFIPHLNLWNCQITGEIQFAIFTTGWLPKLCRRGDSWFLCLYYTGISTCLTPINTDIETVWNLSSVVTCIYHYLHEEGWDKWVLKFVFSSFYFFPTKSFFLSMLYRKLEMWPLGQRRRGKEMLPRLSHLHSPSVAKTQTISTAASTAWGKIISLAALTCISWRSTLIPGHVHSMHSKIKAIKVTMSHSKYVLYGGGDQLIPSWHHRKSIKPWILGWREGVVLIVIQ